MFAQLAQKAPAWSFGSQLKPSSCVGSFAMGFSLLLVCDASESAWLRLVREVVAEFGTLITVNEHDALERIDSDEHDVIILDAASVSDMPRLVRVIRCRTTTTPILVATSSPTWKIARESFLAGATDYVPETLDREKLASILRQALQRRQNNVRKGIEQTHHG